MKSLPPRMNEQTTAPLPSSDNHFLLLFNYSKLHRNELNRTEMSQTVYT